MAKYKIIVIKHQLKGRNVFAVAGDIVDGSQFVNLQDSLNGGFCKEHVEDEQLEDEQLEDKKSTMLKDAGDEPTELELEIKKIKKFSKDELIAFCVENDIEYDTELKKPELLAFIIDILENQTEEEE